ncbi:hypothetical protein [uncultured Campylobacter sp.]|uniref:hypothetical protein n=1 Tax=uncultured Campylobacter sp. TaxID=218934 RepID=UPI002635ED2B|nr:hypothetical protein [uncultured Campylobacter sp.]
MRPREILNFTASSRHEILNLAASELASSRAARFKILRPVFARNFASGISNANPRRFRTEFLRRSCAKFNEISRAELGARKSD